MGHITEYWASPIYQTTVCSAVYMVQYPSRAPNLEKLTPLIHYKLPSHPLHHSILIKQPTAQVLTEHFDIMSTDNPPSPFRPQLKSRSRKNIKTAIVERIAKRVIERAGILN